MSQYYVQLVGSHMIQHLQKEDPNVLRVLASMCTVAALAMLQADSVAIISQAAQQHVQSREFNHGCPRLAWHVYCAIRMPMLQKQESHQQPLAFIPSCHFSSTQTQPNRLVSVAFI